MSAKALARTRNAQSEHQVHPDHNYRNFPRPRLLANSIRALCAVVTRTNALIEGPGTCVEWKTENTFSF